MRRSKLDIILNMLKTGTGGKDAAASIKDVDKAQEEAEGSSKKFSLAQLGLATALAGVTLAAVKQLPELFDLGFSYKNTQIALAAYAGSAEEAEELTKAVTEAAGGAVDKMTAMQNATRLLSLGLAENSQQAAELTRIAITLGATMGKDATGAFEEFTLLLANQSILRLDTFGISAGLVRQRMEELAVTMPEADRQTRFLNATLEIARGRMDELDAAGFQATSSLDVFRARARDLGNELGLLVADRFGPWLDLLLATIGAANPLTDAIKDQLAAMADQGATAEELNREISRLAMLTGIARIEIQGMANDLGISTIATSNLALAMQDLGPGHFVPVAGDVDEMNQVLADYIVESRDAEESTEDLGEAVGEAGESTVRAALQFKNFFQGIDTGLEGTIRGFIEDLEFLAAGGGELQLIGQQIVDALSSGRISEEQSAEMFASLFVRIELLQIELGNITAFEAAINIRDTLGVSLQEARDLVADTQGAIDAIDGSTVTFTVRQNVIIASTTIPGQQGGPPTGPGGSPIIPTISAPPGQQGGAGGPQQDVAQDVLPGVSIGIVNISSEVDLAIFQNVLEGAVGG